MFRNNALLKGTTEALYHNIHTLSPETQNIAKGGDINLCFHRTKKISLTMRTFCTNKDGDTPPPMLVGCSSSRRPHTWNVERSPWNKWMFVQCERTLTHTLPNATAHTFILHKTFRKGNYHVLKPFWSQNPLFDDVIVTRNRPMTVSGELRVRSSSENVHPQFSLV